MPTVTSSTTTAMNLPVAYAAAGQSLAETFIRVDGWRQLEDLIDALLEAGVRPRLAYAYEPPGADKLIAKLVVDVSEPEADEGALDATLAAAGGVHVISVQPPAEPGLVMSERQRPEIVGTPAAIFGRPLIGGMTREILSAQGQDGEHLLSRLGHDAGHLAASGLPPLLKELGLTISDDLLVRRMLDLQVMGWATFEHASITDGSQGEATLVDTFEAAAWEGKASAPTCHFLCGFIEGVFSFAWERSVSCRELECQATGADACRFAWEPAR